MQEVWEKLGINMSRKQEPLIRLDTDGWVEIYDPPFEPREGFAGDGSEFNEFAQGPCKGHWTGSDWWETNHPELIVFDAEEDL